MKPIKVLLKCSIPSASTGIVFNSLCKAFQDKGIDATVQTCNDPQDRIEIWIGPCNTWFPESKGVAVIGYDFVESPRFSTKHLGKISEALSKIDIVLTSGNTAARRYKDFSFDNPILLIPFGVDTEQFRYIERDFHTESFTFLHFATGRRKGTEFVLDAFKVVVSTCPNAHLRLRYYKTPHLPNQQAAEGTISCVNALNIPNVSCEYYGSHNSDRAEAFTVYKDAHCLLAPSYEEGWGMCITEAMATGLPVITTCASTMREYFSDTFGWWVELTDQYIPSSELFNATSGYIAVPDVGSLTVGMYAALTDRELCFCKGKAASEYVNNHLTWRHTVDRLLPLLRTITDRGVHEVSKAVLTAPVRYNYPWISF